MSSGETALSLLPVLFVTSLLETRMRRRFFGTASAAWVALMPFSAAMADWGGGEYHIQQALYGTPERHVDVTARLRDLARRDERLQLGPKTFGADPHPGRVKTLRIVAASANGRMRTFEYTEGSWIDGAQFSDWSGGNWGQGAWGGRPGYQDGGEGDYRILRARYGTAQNHVDVTQRLRELARSDQRFQLSNGTFGVDPDRGRVKQLRIHARGPDGRTRIFEYVEGGWVDGAQFSGWGSGDWGESGGENDWGGDRPGPAYGTGLEIVSAEYGSGRRRVDVTRRLQDRVFNGRLMIKVNNDMAGSDPAEGQPKQLKLVVRINGREQRRVVNEGQFLSLP
jgi:hypothetical protein